MNSASAEPSLRPANAPCGGLPRGRGGLVSAVLLLVLLVTSGLPVEADRVAQRDHVVCQVDAVGELAARRLERARRTGPVIDPAAEPRAVRVPHRARRIDCGGLPPPRAPTV